MNKTNPLRYNTAYLLSAVAVISGVFARGVSIVLFLFLVFMSYLLGKKGKIVLKKYEGNIIAGLMTLVFIPLFFLQDVFVMALYYLLGLLCIKLFVSFEEKDYDHVALLSFLTFSMSAVFLYSMWYILLFVVFSILLGLYLFLRYLPKNITPSKYSTRYILASLLSVTLFSLMLFFFLPRNPYMFFGANAKPVGGDFEYLSIGSFSKEQLSNRVVLRVKPMEKRHNALYLRSRVFMRFDGEKWTEEEKWGKGLKNKVLISKNPYSSSIMYIIYPTLRFTYIPLVDYPVLLSWEGGQFVLYKNLMEVKIEKWPKKMSYRVFASSRPVMSLDTTVTSQYLYVPKNIRNQLKNITKRIKISDDTLFSLIRYLRKNHSYGRFTPLHDTILPILEFLKYQRSGECTEFATSFVLLARLLGYRARMVAGFLSDEYNAMGGYFVVRERHAHAWAEVFKNGRWIRYDPTPPINKKKKFISHLREYYDFLQYLWFTRIVEYSYRDQMHMALKVMPYFQRLRSNSIKRLFIYLLLGIAFAIIMAYFIYNVFFVPFPKKAIKKFLRYMKKNGFSMKKGETLMEFALRSNDKIALQFVKEYYAVRFGKVSCKKLRQLIHLL